MSKSRGYKVKLIHSTSTELSGCLFNYIYYEIIKECKRIAKVRLPNVCFIVAFCLPYCCIVFALFAALILQLCNDFYSEAHHEQFLAHSHRVTQLHSHIATKARRGSIGALQGKQIANIGFRFAFVEHFLGFYGSLLVQNS